MSNAPLPPPYDAPSPLTPGSGINPLIATKYESLISSCLFFLSLNSTLFLVAGALATRYHTTLYIGALAALLSLFLSVILLLLHKIMDTSLGKDDKAGRGVEEGDNASVVKGVPLGGVDNGGSGWRDRLHQNLWEGTYPPNQKMGSIFGMVFAAILWFIASAITIEYHVLIGRGEEPKVRYKQGPLSSYGEMAFCCVCASFSFLCLVVMVVQRRATSKEMRKALSSHELEY